MTTSITSKAVTEFAVKYAEVFMRALETGFEAKDAHDIATTYMVNGFAKVGA